MKLKVAMLTVSTGAGKGEGEDASGAAIREYVEARECLDVVGDVLEHACEVVWGRAHDCGRG